MRALYLFCSKNPRGCNAVTEHRRLKNGKIRCERCGKTRTERVISKVSNIFGLKGRGF